MPTDDAAPVLGARFEEIEEAGAQILREKLPGAEAARVLVIAGSGLGGFVDAVQPRAELGYESIPGVGDSTVVGHAGKLILADLPGKPCPPFVLMAGRRHLYEGLSADESTVLLRTVFRAFPNVEAVVISNAAGGLNPSFAVGDLMLITDHVNWMFKPLTLAGVMGKMENPAGNAAVYSRELIDLAEETAHELEMHLRRGVYVAMHGPSYETRAEVNMLRNVHGADAVGMSTVPEAVVASYAGRRVLGISFISNLLTNPAVTSHEEVVGNAALVEERFSDLLTELLPKIYSQA